MNLNVNKEIVENEIIRRTIEISSDLAQRLISGGLTKPD